ncbi:MAG: DeoR/GlpR transcriptional regulator [Oscillospiraceae bacterium]|nr:DeoR/GlpR transcriptional regulator [Oscillospiraceae bacterium]
MFMEERQREIARCIEEQGKITVAQIVARYAVSDESARRDLRMLEQQGLCRRTHGGALAPVQVSSHPAENRDFAAMPVYETYDRIAAYAAAQVRENDTVYLCGGSFGHILLRHLPKDIPFTVVVNQVDVAKELRGWENAAVYIAGGQMRKSGSVTDAMAAAFVSQMHFDLCFLTGAGLTAGFGLSNVTAETAEFQRTVLKNSRRSLLLMPGSKVGREAFMRVCTAQEFDAVITDWECAPEHITALRESGAEVITVERQTADA